MTTLVAAEGDYFPNLKAAQLGSRGHCICSFLVSVDIFDLGTLIIISNSDQYSYCDYVARV